MMGNVHFVNLVSHKTVFKHGFLYSFALRLVDIELNLVVT